MVKTLLFMLLVSMAALLGQPAKADDAPTLATWLGKPRKDNGEFPRRIAFVSAFSAKGEAPQFLPIDAEDFESVSYLRAVDTRTALWDLKLNQKKFGDTDPRALVFDLTGADSVLLAPDSGEWQLLRRNGTAIVVVAKMRGNKSPTAVVVARWLVDAMGWDGVVLDRAGDYLLVGSTAAILRTPEIQALAVSDSKDKLTLTSGERRGAGLLSLSESDGGFGVFDVVFLGQGVKAIPPGTKLIIEKRKKK